MSNEISLSCQICHTPDTKRINGPPFDGDYFECPRCGKYGISGSLSGSLANNDEYNDSSIMMAKVSYAIKKMQRTETIPIVGNTLFQRLLERDLPTLSEQLNNLVLWLGNNTAYGESIQVTQNEVSVIGANSHNALILVVTTLHQSGYFDEYTPYVDGTSDISLSFQGWQYYEDLISGSKTSNKAFMAMQYGDDELDEYVDIYFRPAVLETGFQLVRLDDTSKAGLIDDRLRVEIRTSRFLIADLTHENRGAYWEAGFAEGLGKPVIYTCETNKFKESDTHFDTNHHLTVLWDKDNPREFQESLKATIRATLLDEANLGNE